jgi:hypothetical protein
LAIWALCCAEALAQTAPTAETAETATTCPVTPQYPLPQGKAALEDLLARLNQAAPQCLLDAHFHAWRGAVLLSLGWPAAAAEALERALLLAPDLPGAQLDYAQALLATGDTQAASELLERVAQRPDLPPQLREILQRSLQHSLATADPTAWRPRWILTTALGHDTNLNNAPAASEITLTFPQGALTLPLLESARPQSGASLLNTLQWQSLKPQGAQLWLLQAELRARHTQPAATRYQQADLSASWLQAPEADRQWVTQVGASRFDSGGQRLYQGVRANMQRQWQAPGLALAGNGTCRLGLGAETEWRHYPASTELNGRYQGLLLTTSCQGATQAHAPTASARQQLSIQLRWGREHPNNANRPGGRYEKRELKTAWYGRLGSYRINAEHTYARQADASGYSPLLSGNLPRSTNRHSLQLEASRALPEGLAAQADWFVSAQASRNTSNIAAFRSRQSALYIGLRWTLQ